MPENCTPNDCPLEPRVSALERVNEQHGNTHREIFRRMNEVERANAVQDERYSAIDKKLDELNVMVRELSSKAGKRWDSLMDKLIWAVAGAVTAFLLGGIGL